MKKFIFFVIVSSFIVVNSSAQFNFPEPGHVFDDSEIPRVDIDIHPDSLAWILDESNVHSDHEFMADFRFTRSGEVDTMEGIGFRLRGASSRVSAKKSFKISFNSFEKGRDFYGLEKMNLNGEHNDPSIVRSKLCWDLFRMAGVPASRSNHVTVYINGEYFGLYINVEHVDDEFLQKRFYRQEGNLYKCTWPADLHYLGPDPNDYKDAPFGDRTYELKTNKTFDDYSDIAHFIDVLNNSSDAEFQCAIERVFDVDNYLKVIVIDELIGNWDGPIVNKNNFYLYYNPANQKMTYIPYDLDNTFGIDWFGIDWAFTSIYNWSAISGEYRPLYERIMNVPEYRNRVSTYFEEYTNNFFNTAYLFPYLDEKKNTLLPLRTNDMFASLDYGYTVDDFLASYDFGLGAHVPIGMKEYIEFRINSVSNQLENIIPQAFVSQANITRSNEKISFDFKLMNINPADPPALELIVNGSATTIVLSESNGYYSHEHIVTTSGILEYRLALEQYTSQIDYWPVCGYYSERLGADPVPNLVINEFMASNLTVVADEFDEFDDWIEIYNASGSTLPLYNYYLSDDPEDPSKWKLPNRSIYPGEYLIIWADNDPEQGSRHTNFNLKKSGEFLGLFDGPENGFAVIDSLTFPSQETDISYGRLPNGSGPFQVMPYITFESNNNLPLNTNETAGETFKIYPNPSSGQINIDYQSDVDPQRINVYSQIGQRVLSQSFSNSLDLATIPSGIYILEIENGKQILKRTLISINR